MVEVRMVPHSPAAILEGGGRHLIIADLHLGFEGRLGAGGIRVGKNTTVGETISEVGRMIDDAKPDTLVLLGDIKSGTGSISKAEWNDVPLFLDEMNRIIHTVLVPGNHDANIQKLVPEETEVAGPAGLVLENSLLTHGHVMPSKNLDHVDRIIMGHIHPVFFREGSVLNGHRVWLSIRAERRLIFPSRGGTIEVTVVPSFNRYLRAEHRQGRRGTISPIIRRIRGAAAARIVTLDGAIIGDESAIGRVI